MIKTMQKYTKKRGTGFANLFSVLQIYEIQVKKNKIDIPTKNFKNIFGVQLQDHSHRTRLWLSTFLGMKTKMIK